MENEYDSINRQSTSNLIMYASRNFIPNFYYILFNFRSKSKIDRSRLASEGKMAKGSGVQASFTIPYDMKMNYTFLPSKNNTLINNENEQLEINCIELEAHMFSLFTVIYEFKWHI